MRHVLVALVLVALSASWAGYRWLFAMPQLRAFAAPAKTLWVPDGPRQAGRGNYAVIPEPDSFHTMHVGTNNTDEIWSVAAPMVRYEWTAEPGLYVPEGPTFDNKGNLCFRRLRLGGFARLAGAQYRARRWSIGRRCRRRCSADRTTRIGPAARSSITAPTPRRWLCVPTDR